MKFYQTALVALLAASASTTTQVVNAQDEEDCTSVLDLACGTEGFSTLCSLIMATAGDLPDGILDTIKTAFAPTDDAFANVKFDLISAEAKLDIVEYHLSTFDLTMECGSLIEMADGKDTRTLCNSDKEPVYQKGASNSRAAMPQFDPTAGIAVCGDATVYVIDSVLIPKEYFIDEDLELVEDQTQEVIDAPDPSDGLDYFKELLVAKGTLIQGVNTCNNMNPQFPNIDCLGEDGTVDVGPQAAANVTKGYVGGLEVDVVPITASYYSKGLCPVNVHWHLGAEHFSGGEYDCDDPKKCGPYHAEDDAAHDDDVARRQLALDARKGFQCNYYDETDAKFTTPYEWQFCDKTMEVGQTYEIHWPHSTAGACGTPNQYQTPFADGVFCNLPLDVFQTLSAQDIASNVGVQAQVFTIVNDEAFYYPNLFDGMIVDGDFGADMAIYTGSTTGASRDNDICSPYAPITWQVDRKCHMISASSFDKMCADMTAQRDDMSDDLYAHGSRELTADIITANNQQTRQRGLLRKINKTN